MLQPWLQQMQTHLSQIAKTYGNSAVTLEERSQLRSEFQKIHQHTQSLLEGWAVLEEQVASILKQHPELAEEEEEVSGEFFLDSQVVRTFRQGQGYYQLKMFGEARPFFHEVVEKEPEFLLGRLYLGLSDFQQENLDEARRQFQLVIQTSEISRLNAFAHHMLGCIHVRQREDEPAIRQFTRALNLDEESGDSWFNLGACYYRLGYYHEAIPIFFHALRVDEEDWEAMYYLSCCYEKLGHHDSVSYWRMATYQKTRHPAVVESIARHFEERGEPRQAIQWYRKLIQADPQRVGAYHGLSWNLWVSGKNEEAMSSLKKGLTLEGENRDLLFTYVWYLLQIGDADQVKKVLSRLPQGLIEHPLWLVLRSRLSVHCGDVDGAETIARQAIETRDAVARSLGYYQLGRVLLEKRDPEQATIAFQNARELSPKWEEPVFFEGLCHLLKGRREQSRQCWEGILSKADPIGP
ncbi:tetratricopeptide repeat protein [Kroppenstedtia eburnea]|uniref:Tetratricopeptide (TPR) repeat n=1 Tax=Kroppenstedtia eburnea TaxID=714067 RepID=A0A1N7IQV3_9BACL|nr:tetratricopeptide repeat protein [Kroppenstedtia eburnea]QKI82093.1 tetratricopeptide repeat protein [Kroppenstedtia eburnea]SIS39386.1 Tetratricopeptide (TPR) repeat [Kroppenstedtia eburnea]